MSLMSPVLFTMQALKSCCPVLRCPVKVMKIITWFDLSPPQRSFDCFLLVEPLLSVHARKCGRGKEGASAE